MRRALLWPAQVDVCSKSPSVLFDYPQLLKCPVEGLAWAISERPQEAIPCLCIAVHEALFVDRWGPAWLPGLPLLCASWCLPACSSSGLAARTRTSCPRHRQRLACALPITSP